MCEHEVTLPETHMKKCGGDNLILSMYISFGNPDPGIPETCLVRTVLDQLQLSILFEITVTINYYYYYYYYYIFLGTVFSLQRVVL